MGDCYFYLTLHLKASVTVVGKAKYYMLVREDFPQEKQTELQVAKHLTSNAQIIKISYTVVFL